MPKKRLAPLPASMMLMSIVGLLASILWVWPLDTDIAFAFIVLFAAMFLACMHTMRYGPVPSMK